MFVCTIWRSSRPEVFCKEGGALRNFAKFAGKHLCQSVLFNKVAGLSLATLLKKRLWQRRFPVIFAKFLRISSPTKHLWRLLLIFVCYFILEEAVWRCSTKKLFQKHSQNSREENLRLRPSQKKLQIKKTVFQCKCFPANLENLKKQLFQNTCKRLLLF